MINTSIANIPSMGYDAQHEPSCGSDISSSWCIPRCDKRDVTQRLKTMSAKDFIRWGCKAYEVDSRSFVRRVERMLGMKHKTYIKKKTFNIDGVCYLSTKSAAEALGVSTARISGMCRGVKVNGKFYPPKPGCYIKIIKVLVEKDK